MMIAKGNDNGGVPQEIRRRFADRIRFIEALAVASEAFRELCCDYQDCVDALRRLTDSKIPNRERIEEYRSLITELEQEIETAIRKCVVDHT